MDKYFFIHVPKTGGTSMFRIFRDFLGPENVAVLVEDFPPGQRPGRRKELLLGLCWAGTYLSTLSRILESGVCSHCFGTQ